MFFELMGPFQQLTKFLLKYRLIWEKEVLERYPNYQELPLSWLEYLKAQTIEDLFRFDQEAILPERESLGLQVYLDQIKEINELIPYTELGPIKFPAPDWTGIKEKKRHELACLRQFLRDPLTKWPSFVDYCSGKGHLAQILAQEMEVRGLCLDHNQELQKQGREQWNSDRVHYKAMDLLLESDVLPGNSIHLGLHTCGHLAIRHFELANENLAPAILNFGCCYYKVPKLEYYNLSRPAKNGGLPLSFQALTLASKSYMNPTLDDFKWRFVVKKYRYSFQALLKDQYGIEEFVPLGKPPSLKIYDEDFASYACFFLKRLNLSPPSIKNLESFYQKESTSIMRMNLICADLIRLKLARPLEIYILMDRKLWLEEQGYEVQMRQFFNPQVSPRNIGIWAKRS